MLISVALGSFGCGYDPIFCRCMLGSLVLGACWVLWLWLKVKKVIFASFFIMFASYSETHLMFGVLICLHVDVYGTWIARLWVRSYSLPLWYGCMLCSLALAHGKKIMMRSNVRLHVDFYSLYALHLSPNI